MWSLESFIVWMVNHVCDLPDGGGCAHSEGSGCVLMMGVLVFVVVVVVVI